MIYEFRDRSSTIVPKKNINLIINKFKKIIICFRSSSRPFTSRFLKSRYLSSSDDESNETDEEKRRQNNVDNDANTSNGEQQNNGG